MGVANGFYIQKAQKAGLGCLAECGGLAGIRLLENGARLLVERVTCEGKRKPDAGVVGTSHEWAAVMEAELQFGAKLESLEDARQVEAADTFAVLVCGHGVNRARGQATA